jgi:hypothetical protein
MSDMNNLDSYELNTNARMNHLLVVSLMLLAPLLFLSTSQAFANLYFNSSEPGCDGSDPTVVWCDDFEDGDWGQTDENGLRGGTQLTTNAETYTPNDGWFLDGFYPLPNGYGRGFPATTTPAKNYVFCGGYGVAGTNCAATSGPRMTIQGDPKDSAGMMGKHSLAPNRASYKNLYLRWYIKPLTGFQWGHEKMMTINPCCLQIGIHLGSLYSPFSSGIPTFLNYADGQKWLYQNRNTVIASTNRPDPNNGNKQSYYMNPGDWHSLQIHIDSGAGVYEMWADNCGADGLMCTGSPTLIAQYTGVNWGGMSIGTIWLENWSSAASKGEAYYDQFKAATVGPIPFSDNSKTSDTVPPAGPVNLRIQ